MADHFTKPGEFHLDPHRHQPYAAIAAALPGNVGVVRERAHNGDYFVWLDPGLVNRLAAMTTLSTWIRATGGQIKLHAYVKHVALVVGLSFFLPSITLGKPLTKADIEGKKICFGSISNSFSSGGKVTNTVAGRGTWSLGKANTIRVSFPGGPYSGVFRDLGGGSVEYSGSFVGTPKTRGVGGYCN
jgi:hypothetical protein